MSTLRSSGFSRHCAPTTDKAVIGRPVCKAQAVDMSRHSNHTMSITIRRAKTGSRGHLHELDSLQGQLSENVGVAAEEDMPKVVHFPRPLSYVSELLIVEEPNRRPACGCMLKTGHDHGSSTFDAHLCGKAITCRRPGSFDLP